MNSPKCPNCHEILREQWSSKVKVAKAYKIMAKHGIPLEEIARALNINLGQITLLSKEVNAVDSGTNRWPST